MSEATRPRYWVRMGTVGAAVGLALVLTGDVGVHGALAAGIDPLEVLNLQIRNNALIVFDTSGSMRSPTETGGSIGGDDPRSRMYQAKQAVKAVVQRNQSLMNFGLASYNIPKSNKHLDAGGNAELRYVSADDTAAVFVPYFDDFSNNFGDVDGNTSSEVYRSFESTTTDPYPFGCVGTACDVYFLSSALFRHGKQFEWDLTTTTRADTLQNAAPFTVTTPCNDYPPAGLTGDNPDANGDGTADERRPWIKMVDDATGNYACFYLSSGIFQRSGGDSCGGAAQLAVVADCTGNNAQLVLNEMNPEMPIGDFLPADDFGLGTANTAVDYDGGFAVPLIAPAPPAPAVPTNRPTGLRAGQNTPLEGALNDVRTAPTPYFPPEPAAVAGLQKNFVILLTDGDDTCASTTPSRAHNVALAAQALYNGPDFQHRAELMFIAFTSGVNLVDANRIARAGSGGVVQSNSTVTCSAGVPCRDAFVASNTDELVTALQNALEIAVSSGTFVASPSVVGTVFEVGPENPLDPNVRYTVGGTQRLTSNVLFQPSFDLPAWNAELAAFNNDGTATPLMVGGVPWEAGQLLFDSVSGVMQAQSRAARPVNRFTFSELHDGRTVDGISTGNALIPRRIFTSAGGGRWQRTSGSQYDSSSAAGRNVLALWPPNQAGLTPETNTGTVVSDIDPTIGTVGPLDDALGIGAGSTPVLTFAELQNKLGVCRSSADPDPQNGGTAVPAPPACATSDLDTARKEARQVLLAWLAGAELARGTDGQPLRNGVAGAEFRQLLYKDRGDLIQDSTLAQPAVMQQPRGEREPGDHGREWTLYRDGHRNAAREGVPSDLDRGFGLTNPDGDDANPETKLTLKPRPTVIFYPTNLLLHAFKAATAEEMWAYLPFDQLDHILQLVSQGQSRDNHTYGIATAVRVGDLFDPVPFTEGTFTFDGRWRTAALFGRGPGGKHVTVLDVTSPGPFTRPALETNPPWVMWSRGNPDVDLAGNAVRTADTFPYSRMGETWSVPALGRTTGSPEWRVWMGSGYTDDPVEGKMFYEMSALTGDVLLAQDLPNAGAPNNIAQNALVASPSAWNYHQLRPPRQVWGEGASDTVSRVYIPDLHGRIWKFDSVAGSVFFDAGVLQPFTEAVALGWLGPGTGEFVYAGAGRDTREGEAPGDPATPPAFKIFGIQDTEGDAGTTIPGTLVFSEDYPDVFRNRTQPAVGFSADPNDTTTLFGRVFFLGQRFNPPGANCVSSFDAVLFALGGATGAYVYDFDGDNVGDAYTVETGEAPLGLAVEGGRVERPTSQASPTPFTKPPPPDVVSPQIITHHSGLGTPVCRVY